MSFEIVVFAILSLIVVFIIERIYRKVMDLENKIDIHHRKFHVMEKMLQQHNNLMKEFVKEIKKLKSSNGSDSNGPESPNQTDNSLVQCKKCNKFYSKFFDTCPYCS